MGVYNSFLEAARICGACESSLQWWREHPQPTEDALAFALKVRSGLDWKFLRSMPIDMYTVRMFEFFQRMDPLFLAMRIFRDWGGLSVSCHDLSGLDAHGVDARSITLTSCDLSGCVFDRCDFRHAVLVGCDLRGATFRHCRMEAMVTTGSDFSKAMVED